MTHPYRYAPTEAFWSRAVSEGWDALALGRLLVAPGEKVVSAGSCFAANIIPFLVAAGCTYVRTEVPNPVLINEERFGYDTFSAAYGNIYTARQLLQLLQRATGEFRPAEDRWRDGGHVIDPFRPGLAYPARSDQEFDLLTAQHLACALDAFRQADVFVFTLGLTEAWLAMDGAVFPACPGTIAGSFDPARHRFHNFTAGEVAEDLRAFVAGLRRINPGVRLVLTVSPVPLVATATGRHVLLATTYSKAALRIAAEEASRMEGVAYFPAYEIVTGPQAPHDYFEADRRTVSPAGIVAVMSAFLGGRASAAVAVADQVAAPSLSRALIEAECEELMAER